MFNRKITFSLAAVMALTGITSTALAREAAYECTLTERANRGPVPEKISVTIDQDNAVATVQDIYTKQVSSAPMPAEITDFFPGRISIAWRLTGLAYQGSENKVTAGIVDYKLTLRTNTNKISLSGVSREFYSRIYGEGSCVNLR